MRRELSKLITVLAPLLCAAQVAKGEAPTAPTTPQATTLGKASRLWVEGDSTLHKYHLDAKELQVQVFAPAAAAGAKLSDLATNGGIKSLEVHVPVRGLSSGESGLDDNMRHALKADQAREIVFRMDSYTAAPGADAAQLAVKVKGRLEIAGVERPLELEATAARAGTGLHVSGAQQLLMTDYGVKPPKFMLGAMSCSDAVTIHFDLDLEPAF